MLIKKFKLRIKASINNTISIPGKKLSLPHPQQLVDLESLIPVQLL